MLRAGPTVGCINPVKGFVGGAFERDTTAISSCIARACSRAKLDILVVHRDGGAVHRRRGAVDRQVTTDNQVVTKGRVAAKRCAAQVNRSSKRLVARNGLRASQADKRTITTNRNNAGCTTPGTTSAVAVVQNAITGI